jgi:hypothetical protein
MRINLREGSLEATLTESGATLLRFRLITAYDEQKVRDAQKEAQAAKDRAAVRLDNTIYYTPEEFAEHQAILESDLGRPLTSDELAGVHTNVDTINAEYARLQGILDRAAAEADRLWHTQPTGRYFCLEGAQIGTAIQMCRGTLKSPCGEVGLADGYRHIRFYKDGLRIFGDSDSECSIEFPGPVMANAIDAVCDNLENLIKYGIPNSVNPAHPDGKAQSFTATVELTRDFVRDLEKGYAPWVEWAYNDYTDIEGYPPMYRKISEDRQDSRVSDRTLTEALDGLARVAESYSNGKVGDGKPTLIHLSYDSRPGDTPASYYFWIEPASGGRAMNGGVIAHQKYAKEGAERIQEWSYSTHT